MAKEISIWFLFLSRILVFEQLPNISITKKFSIIGANAKISSYPKKSTLFYLRVNYLVQYLLSDSNHGPKKACNHVSFDHKGQDTCKK